MKKRLLIIVFFLFPTWIINAQDIVFHPQCYDITEEDIICDHDLLSNFSLIMNEEASDQGPNNECDGSNEHDRSWMAFEAPEGDYFMRVNLSNCTAPFTSIKGAQVSIYKDCDYEETIYCSNLCTQGSRDLPQGLFEAGEIYYMLIDGCFGSVCDINIRLIGSGLNSNCLTGTYIPMDTITDWHFGVGGLGGFSDFWHFDDGDTLINGLEYRKIGTYPEPDFPWYRFIREDRTERKVYENYNGTDHILYDFSLELGDVLTYSSGTSAEVINIDTVESMYGPLRRWELDGPGPSFYVTEAVGSDYLFFPVGVSDPVYSLLSAYTYCEKVLGSSEVQPARWVSVKDTLTTTICEGDTLIFNSKAYWEIGMYSDTLSNSLGCDSIVTLDLKVDETVITNQFMSKCADDLCVFEGDTLYTSGVYQAAYNSHLGCDSIVILELEIIDIPMTFIAESICPFDEYIFGTDTLSSSGNYNLILVSEMGCDSIVSLDLTVLEENDPDCISSIKDDYVTQVKLYPNPVEDILKISSNRNIGELSLFDHRGKLIIQRKPISKTATIHLEGLLPGVYFIYLNSNEGFIVKRVIKL